MRVPMLKMTQLASHIRHSTALITLGLIGMLSPSVAMLPDSCSGWPSSLCCICLWTVLPTFDEKTETLRPR